MTDFCVGGCGRFDALAAKVAESAKKRHPAAETIMQELAVQMEAVKEKSPAAISPKSRKLW